MSGYNDSYDGGNETSTETTDTTETTDHSAETGGKGSQEASSVSKDSSGNSTSGHIELSGNKTEASEVNEKSETGKSTEKEEEDKPTFEPNSKVNIDGNYYRTDDKGNIHMYYDKDDKDAPWKLVPDNKYTVNGYEYTTDSKERIVEAKGTITPRDDSRDSLNAKVEDMKENDQRGHVIADVNNGSNRIDNLVAMDKDLNTGKYEDLEKELNKAAKDHDVKATYTLIYNENNDTKRPDAIAVNYTIDGEEYHAMFYNDSENNSEEDK